MNTPPKHPAPSYRAPEGVYRPAPQHAPPSYDEYYQWRPKQQYPYYRTKQRENLEHYAPAKVKELPYMKAAIFIVALIWGMLTVFNNFLSEVLQENTDVVARHSIILLIVLYISWLFSRYE